jgi:uncharacterized membrane protein YccC
VLRAAFMDHRDGLGATAIAHVLALSGQIRAMVELEKMASLGGRAPQERAPVPAFSFWLDRFSGTLRAKLSLRSAGFRHAVRMAACVVIAEALARAGDSSTDTGYR